MCIFNTTDALVEQKLPTLPEHLSSPLDISGALVTRSLVLYVRFVDLCLFFCIFFFWPLCCLFLFDLYILITSLASLTTMIKCGSFEKY